MLTSVKSRFLTVLFGALLILPAPTPARAMDADSLLEAAKTARKPRYQFAVKNNAEIHFTNDHKSFYLFWKPENYSPETTPVIVTVGGHATYAFDDFFVWHPFVKKRGYAVFAIQWWLGEGERFQDYLTPNEIYRAVDDFFKENKITAPALLHGFSRGSANSYAIAAMDVNSGNRYFKMCIANAGKPGLDFPPNKDIVNGKFGEKPLEGTRWATYAGGKDTHPDRDGFEGMREAGRWIEKYGGQVVLAIEDPDGDHGGFHRNPKNAERALDEFDKLK